MSTTLYVNSISDLSIYARQKAGGGPLDKEWILESPTYDAATQQWSTAEFILSDHYTSLESDGRNGNGHLQIIVETLQAEPTSNPSTETTNSQNSPYQFGGGPGPQKYIVIEDITMGYKWPDPLPSNVYNLGANQMMMIINIEETGSDQYQHRVWSN